MRSQRDQAGQALSVPHDTASVLSTDSVLAELSQHSAHVGSTIH
jgi:hypothetical protein